VADDDWRALVRRLVAGFTDTREEATLLAMLADATNAQLEWLSLDRHLTHDLVTSIEDHIAGDPNRRRLLDWAVGRLPNLEPSAQAAWLPAFTGIGDLGRQAIVAIMQAATGDGLRRLLDAVDARGDHKDLAWIVFDHLDDEQREVVLAHIQEQAAGWVPCVRVICDVDDTLFASINEPVYPGGAMYPGALAFLARCGQVHSHSQPITVLTARPEGQGGVLEDRLRRELAARGVAAATVLSGRTPWLFGDGAMAAGKGVNLAHMVALHPADRFVLVGDSGQGDVTLARQALSTWPGCVLAVFIHMVIPSQATLRSGELDHPDGRIVFFGTYVEAAREALALGLMSRTDVAAVIAEARGELAGIGFHTVGQAGEARSALESAIISITA